MSFLYTYCVINYNAMSTMLTVTSTLNYSYQVKKKIILIYV